MNVEIFGKNPNYKQFVLDIKTIFFNGGHISFKQPCAINQDWLLG